MENREKIIYITMGVASLAVAAFIFGYNRYKSSTHISSDIDVSGNLIPFPHSIFTQLSNRSKRHKEFFDKQSVYLINEGNA
jgi:hypothetical protein